MNDPFYQNSGNEFYQLNHQTKNWTLWYRKRDLAIVYLRKVEWVNTYYYYFEGGLIENPLVDGADFVNEDCVGAAGGTGLYENPRVKYIFMRFDADANGKLSYPEAKQFIVAISPTIELKNITNRIQFLDRNRDGSITKEELTKSLRWDTNKTK